MIKFNDDNIYVGYIKQLLHTFNLPCCKIDKLSNKFYVGEYFINNSKNAIYKVLSVNSNGRPIESLKICDYKFGDRVLNITKNLEIRNNYYDTYTHEYLGEYLRFIRDFKDIDLISLCNCFSNNLPTTLNSNGFNSNDSLYTVYMIPVKSNTTYTIALDCHTSVKIGCGHYAYHNLLDLDITNVKTFNNLRFNTPILYTVPEDNNLKLEKTLKMFIKIPSSVKSSLVVLEGDYLNSCKTICTQSSKDIGLKFFEYISNLVPYEQDGYWYFNKENTHISTSNNVFTIRYIDNRFDEGEDALNLPKDYTNEDYQRVKNRVYRKYYLSFYTLVCGDDVLCADDLSCSDSAEWESSKVYLRDVTNANYDFTTKCQLLQLSSNEKYLLANRLVEYLSSNAITPDDEVANNIKKVQLIMAGNYEDKLSFGAYGHWIPEMREWIYKYLCTHEDARGVKLINDYNDLLSYVDKEVESNLSSVKIEKRAMERLNELGGGEHGI